MLRRYFYLLMLINQSNTFIFFSIYIRYYSFLRLSSFFALFAIIWYFLPLELYCLARIYAEYTPFLLLLQVFFLQIGNDLFGPKKHFFPHFLSILVLCDWLGESFFHPLVTLRLWVLRLLVWLFLRVLFIYNLFTKKNNIITANIYFIWWYQKRHKISQLV